MQLKNGYQDKNIRLHLRENKKWLLNPVDPEGPLKKLMARQSLACWHDWYIAHHARDATTCAGLKTV